MQRATRRWALLLGVGVSGGFGCSTAPDAATADAQTGSVQIALDATSAANVSYHLGNATFLITGPTTTTLSGETPTVQTDLPPGSYQIQLLDGFTVSQVNPDGTQTALQATLQSKNPQAFGIRSQHTTAVSFAFKVGEVVVTTGDGTLTVTATVDDTSIDDFEDGDGRLSPLGGRNGTWFTANDGSGTQTPAPGTPVVPEVDTNANFLLHGTGKGFGASGEGSNFGALVGVDLLDGPNGALPYDASAYTGISFTYTLTSAAEFSFNELRLNIGTSETTPVQFGGTCTASCFDDFGTFLFPTSFPTNATISFSQLSQEGFGAPTTFDAAALLQFKWNVIFEEQPGDFDFTLDNVAFTK
jgi:hypothetical protein